MYKRILLKFSGEQLAGDYESGIDTKFAAWLAHEVKQVRDAGVEVVIVVGGGNYVRGAQITSDKLRRVTGDYMGMLATLMNALALTDVFEAEGVSARCLSNIFAEQVAEPFVYRNGIDHLQQSRVVVVGGGAGRPYITTDTAALVVALELDCDVIMKVTKVDGVYDKDPAKYPDAVRYRTLTLQQAIADEQIKVMDRAALGLAMDHRMPIIVFDGLHSGNILRVTQGDETVGTTLRHEEKRTIS